MIDSDHRPPVSPLLALFFGILAVSAASIFIRFAQTNAPSLVIAAYRLALATLILSPVALSRHRSELGGLNRRELGLALLSGFFLALHFATWITSLEYTSVASSVVLVTTTPLWVALLAPFTLKEALSRTVRLGMVLALIGGVVVGLSDTCAWTSGSLVCPPLSDFMREGAFWGDLLALAGAIMAAAYVLIGRRLRGNMSLITYIYLVYGMALVPQLLGHSTFNWALRYLSAAYVSITLLGEPIGSTILAYFLLKETPSALKIFGAILILVGIYVASQSEARQAKLKAEQLEPL
jgi:drug/metabolite transporter (DMT)-like permease